MMSVFATRTLNALAMAVCVAVLFAVLLAPTLGLGQSANDRPEAASRSLNQVDWAAAQRDAQAAGVAQVAPGGGLLSFEGTGRASADNLQIPVLIPRSLIEASRDGALDQPMELLARTNDYSVEARIAPNSFLISGTRVVFETDAEIRRAIPAVEEVYVEPNEYGITASFERYGAVYTIEIFCPLPTADPLCLEETRVRTLAAEMTFAP
ncbi:MAG: hypothetical protein AAF909_14625 [Pseudomonadota bacterium]